jgi:hypothetical protein
MCTEAESAPAIAGLNVTVMVQVAPAATPVPQVLVWLNDLGLGPVMVIPWPVPFSVSVDFPVFVRVRDCVAAATPTVVAANVSVVAETFTTGEAVEVGQ